MVKLMVQKVMSSGLYKKLEDAVFPAEVKSLEGEGFHGKRQGQLSTCGIEWRLNFESAELDPGSVRVWRLRMMGTSFLLLLFFLAVTAPDFLDLDDRGVRDERA